MRIRLLLAGLSLISVLIMGGCTMVSQSQPNGPLGVKVAAPMKADIEVGEKISGSSSASIICCFIPLPEFQQTWAEGVDYTYHEAWNPPIQGPKLPSTLVLERLRGRAAYEAVSKSKADVIIAPRYMIEDNDFVLFRTLNVTVTGYKGTVKSIKPTENFRENF